MADDITPQEQGIVTKLKALVGADSKPLFDFADSYNGLLEGKKEDELKAELERRGMHTAFVFSQGGKISHIRRRGVSRHKLPEFVVLIGVINLSGDASTRVGSPSSAGAYQIICQVIDALDAQIVASGSVPIYAKEWTMLLTTQEVALGAVIFDHVGPAPYERP
jgi:hypothetical protein